MGNISHLSQVIVFNRHENQNEYKKLSIIQVNILLNFFPFLEFSNRKADLVWSYLLGLFQALIAKCLINGTEGWKRECIHGFEFTFIGDHAYLHLPPFLQIFAESYIHLFPKRMYSLPSVAQMGLKSWGQGLSHSARVSLQAIIEITTNNKSLSDLLTELTQTLDGPSQTYHNTGRI